MLFTIVIILLLGNQFIPTIFMAYNTYIPSLPYSLIYYMQF
jgi:hypothetical protein